MSISGNRKVRFIDGELVEYEIVPLVDQYDPILRQPTIPVEFDKMAGGEIAFIAMSMMESLNHHGGLGLSANQVGWKYRMFSMTRHDIGKVWCLINPIILDISNKMVKTKEGCLSFPNLFIEVERPDWVEVGFCAVNGEGVKHRFTGIEATVVQHELDHLNGICFTDKISPLKLDMAKRRSKNMLRRIKRAPTTVSP
jgi:peptide deformylase